MSRPARPITAQNRSDALPLWECDERLVIDMMTGDLQRIIEYPARGFTIPQHVPSAVAAAYERLRAAGFVGRAVPR